MDLTVTDQTAITDKSKHKRLSYGLSEISLLTGLSTAFLRKEARAGNLKTKKFGARRMVLIDDLQIYLKGAISDEK